MPETTLQRPVVLLVVPEGASAPRDATRASLARQSALGEPEVRELPASQPFGATLAKLAREAEGRDVVCLRAGVELPFAWDARLARAAHAEPSLAAAVPLCDASPLHALLPPGAAPPADWEQVDRSVYAMGTRGYYSTPALHDACAWLRGDALRGQAAELASDEAAPAECLNRLASRWRAAGRESVLCDFVYVALPEGALEAAPGVDPVEASAFARHHPLGALRRSIAAALEQGLPPVAIPGLDARPVQLHIMHFWGGGLDKWVRDFGRADRERANLMLATYRIGEDGGQRVVLYGDPDATTPLHTWDIAQPLRATAVASLEYRRILEQVVRDYDVESIIVSSLIGHSLEALRQPVKTVVVAHDFYPLCLAINPRLDATCRNCGLESFEACARDNGHYEVLGRPSAGQWAALREAYVAALLERSIPIVAPSESAAATLLQIEPRLAAAAVRVIPHGIDFPVEKLPYPRVERERRLRLVVLGRLPDNKGAGLLREAAAALKPIADISLVGCGARAVELARECGWAAIEEYTHEELPLILRGIAPHAAILASVVPETFSYTLSELRALGIPALATALGAFRDRIRDGVDGFLFEPTAEALHALVARLAAEPAALERVARELSGAGAARSAREMVEDYHELLPLAERPVARFAIGVGEETALTEPYRHLERAYAELNAAYQRLSEAYAGSTRAYEHTRAEYDRAHAELQKLRALCEEYSLELQRLHVGYMWWRAPRAERLVSELRARMQQPDAVAAAAEKNPGTGNTE